MRFCPSVALAKSSKSNIPNSKLPGTPVRGCSFVCLFVIKYILISFETDDHAFQFNLQKQNFKVKKTEDKKHLVYEG